MLVNRLCCLPADRASDYFVSGKVRCLSHPRSRTVYIVIRYLPRVRALPFLVGLHTYISSLRYHSSMGQRFENRAVPDLCCGAPEKVFFRCHEVIEAGRTWHYVSKKLSDPLDQCASKVSEMLLEEIYPSFWTRSMRNYSWTVTLHLRVKWLRILLVGSLLKNLCFDDPSPVCSGALQKDGMYGNRWQGSCFSVTWWFCHEVIERSQQRRTVYRHGHQSNASLCFQIPYYPVALGFRRRWNMAG